MRAQGLGLLVAAMLLAPSAIAFADTGPALTVDASAGRHPISPYIYGWNFAPAPLAAQIDLPVDRRGGNAADTLNWQNGVENHSNDFFFENIPWCWTRDPCDAGISPSHSYTDQIDADRVIHAQSLIDVPMLGYVPKDAAFSQPLPCSFTKADFATQDRFDEPYDPGCGNGQNGNNWVTNAPQLANATADSPAAEALWIDDLKARYNTAANGGVGFYELGNEPGLWNSTHHDWHPAAVTYDELWSKSQALASAIKGEDPSAQILGFSEWGWPNYFCSAADDTSDGCSADDTDRAGHGGTPIVEWLLQQFKSWADSHDGQRLIDYLDVHYYRQDNHSTGFRATRSLWDPTYTDESWIGDKIRMIPRMHEWVDQNYPGTKIALSEYDLAIDSGSDDTHVVEDNLIEADVLGIFGREQLDLATLWPETGDSHYADAFRLFRDYDGNRSKFGETSVSSQSGDQSRLAVYGAQRSVDNALTVVVVNKSQSDLTSTLSLAGFTPGGSAQVFRWDGRGAIGRDGDQAVDGSGFSATFPARSMTMVVIPSAGTPLAPGPGPPPGGDVVLPGAPRLSPPAAACHVPRVVGLTLKKAKARLKRAHCRAGKVTKKHSHKRKGRVIKQKPKPKTRLGAGGKVALVLSRGR